MTDLAGYAEAEQVAAFDLITMMHRASSERFEATGWGFVCANGTINSVWDASIVQVDPDRDPPALDELLEASEKPARWFPQLRHRSAMIGGDGDERRELGLSLARRGWEVEELWLMSCRVPPARVPPNAGTIEGEAMRRLKGRLGIEQGSPAEIASQFDRYDELRGRRAARFSFAANDETGSPAALATAWLRGDIALIEDVATLSRRRRQGLGRACVLAAVAQVLRIGARAVTLFAEPDVGRGFYEPLGFERIGGAWDCKRDPKPADGGDSDS